MLWKALKSKTVWLGIIIAALSSLQGYIEVLTLSAKNQAMAGFVISALIIVLRFMTTSSINDK